MAKKDSDLFERLRRVGVRKQVARTLSEIGEGASKKALRAGRSAATELRALADEIERRLPAATSDRNATGGTARPAGSRSRASSTRTSRPRATRASSASARRPATRGQRTAATPSATAASGRRAATPARGQNKAKILAALKAGPKTASQIAQVTGIGAGTVSSTLTRMAKAGEVVKAERGYGLPS